MPKVQRRALADAAYARRATRPKARHHEIHPQAPRQFAAAAVGRAIIGRVSGPGPNVELVAGPRSATDQARCCLLEVGCQRAM
jgi:hypothetical protein